MRMLSLTAATILTICLFSASNAQEVENRKDFGTLESLVFSGTPSCYVETEVDIFTEERKHEITCTVRNTLGNEGAGDEHVDFSGTISSIEEDSIMLLTVDLSMIAPTDEVGESALIRIDQNPPEMIGEILGRYLVEISRSIEIKDFLNQVKDGNQRAAIRIGRDTVEFEIHRNIRSAIEEFLSRTENLPAFRIQD